MNRTRSVARTVRRAVGSALLTVLSVLGVLCIVGVIAAWIWGYSIVLFSTGSMAPTITAGSAAVVRQIPAADVRVGDVVTVARPNLLPVTHRVRAIETGPGAERILTLRGDANASDDAVPYRVDTVRRVLFSVPGIATFVHQLGNPLVLGIASLVMALFVGWVFWPRQAPSDHEPCENEDDERDGPVGGLGSNHEVPTGGDARGSWTPPPPIVRAGGAAAVVLVVAMSFSAFGSVRAAQAAVTEQVHHGRYLTLVAVGDLTAMHTMLPGIPVDWQVGVSVAAPERGRVTVSMVVTGDSRDIRLQASVCAQRWAAGRCSSGARTVLGESIARDLVGSVIVLDTLPTDRRAWVQVRAVIPAGAGGEDALGTAQVRLRAQAFGDQVDAGGPPIGPLPNTGVPAGLITTSAFVAILVGALLLGVVDRRRRRMAS